MIKRETQRIFLRTMIDYNLQKEVWKVYYKSLIWDKNITWRGIPTQKHPCDLWIYQEIICEKKPDIIIETGTLNGGSALFMANICDVLNNGIVMTIDINSKPRNIDSFPNHSRIEYIVGSSTNEEIFSKMKRFVYNKNVMVILDSNHSYNHVFRELELYSSLVTSGQYLIVEDTDSEYFGGNSKSEALKALTDFLENNNDFIVDRKREKFIITQNPKGFLLKI